MDKDIAIHVVKKVNSLLGQLNEVLCDLDGNVDEAEFHQYKKSIAQIMHISDLEIIKPITDKYPDIDQFST